MHEVRVKTPPYDDDDDERTTPDSFRIKREPEDDDEDDPAPLSSPQKQQEDHEPQHRARVPWVVPPRRNLLRKTDAVTGKAKRRRPCHTKNAFHLDLRNKWSQLLTDKISALAFARALEGHRCS